MCHTEEEAARLKAAGLKGIAIPGHRLSTPLHDMLPMFKYMERSPEEAPEAMERWVEAPGKVFRVLVKFN